MIIIPSLIFDAQNQVMSNPINHFYSPVKGWIPWLEKVMLKILLSKYRLLVKRFYIISLIVSALICILGFYAQNGNNDFVFSYIPIIASVLAFMFLLIYKFNELFPDAYIGPFRIIRITRGAYRKPDIGISPEAQEKRRIKDATENMLTLAAALIPISAICLIISLLINL